MNVGLNEEEGVREGKGCLEWGKGSCMKGWGVGMNMGKLMKNIEGGELVEGGKRLKGRSGLGGVWGGVCGEEKECE